MGCATCRIHRTVADPSEAVAIGCRPSMPLPAVGGAGRRSCSSPAGYKVAAGIKVSNVRLNRSRSCSGCSPSISRQIVGYVIAPHDNPRNLFPLSQNFLTGWSLSPLRPGSVFASGSSRSFHTAAAKSHLLMSAGAALNDSRAAVRVRESAYWPLGATLAQSSLPALYVGFRHAAFSRTIRSGCLHV